MTFFVSCNTRNKDSESDKSKLSVLSKLEDQLKEENIQRTTDVPPPPPLRSTVKFTAPVITDEPVEENESNSGSKATLANVVVDKKKIIRDGGISIQTNDVSACKKGVEALVKSLGGYIESEYLQNDDERISYNMKARIPAINFDKMMSGLENGKDEVKSKNVQARDVTEEYVDVESRLANKLVYLKRYKELLTKASTVRDILTIEEQIRVIQEEIESKEGRLKYLNDQVAFSTLDIHFYKEKEYAYKPKAQDKFGERVKDALSDGWRAINNFVLWMIRLWPFILLVLVIFYGIKWRKHGVKKSKITKE